MELISQWVKNIIFIILITTFLQLFLPENKMQKYVKVIMGFFIIAVFISPLSTVFNQDPGELYKIIPEKIETKEWDNIVKKGEEIGKSNQTMLEGYYKKRITGKIKEIVNLDFPDWDKAVNLDVNQDYQLKKIYIKLYKKEVENVKIDQVKIGTDDKSDRKQQQDKYNQKILNLENKLSKIFQIPSNVINIDILNWRE